MTKEETLASREAERLAKISSPEEMQTALLRLFREARATHVLQQAARNEFDGRAYITGEVEGAGRHVPLGPADTVEVGQIITTGGDSYYIASLAKKKA